MRRPPTALTHVLKSVFLGGAAGVLFGELIIFVDAITDRQINPVLHLGLQLAVSFLATVYAGHWLIQQYKKQGWWPVVEVSPPRTITPGDIQLGDDEFDDPLKRHVIAQSWNSGKPMVGWYDEEGKMHFREQELPLIPISRHDVDGTILDGFAEAVVMMDDDMALGLCLRNLVDLDGVPMVLPPGSRVEGAVPGIQIVEREDDD